MTYDDEIQPVIQAKKVRKKRRWDRTLRSLLIYLGLSAGAVTMIAPFLWMITTSLSESGAIFSDRTWWKEWIPTTFHWSNYIEVWKVIPFGRFYLNSIFISCALTFGQVVTSSL